MDVIAGAHRLLERPSAQLYDLCDKALAAGQLSLPAEAAAQRSTMLRLQMMRDSDNAALCLWHSTIDLARFFSKDEDEYRRTVLLQVGPVTMLL